MSKHKKNILKLNPNRTWANLALFNPIQPKQPRKSMNELEFNIDLKTKVAQFNE